MHLPDALGYTYNTYRYTVILAPLIALAACLLGLVVTVYTIILVCWPFKRNVKRFAEKELPHKLISEVEGEGGKIPCWTCIFGGLKLVYGHQVNESETRGQPPVYTICGRHVRPWLLAVLFLVVVFVCACTAVTFWCEFLVDESNKCDTSMDCFAINSTTKSILQQKPLQNCTEYESNDEYSIHCFKFSFNYASALGDAGGVLVLASVIMNIQAGLWIGASSQQGKWSWYCAVGWVTTLNIVIEAILIAAPIVVNSVPLFKSTVTNSDRNMVQFHTYWITFLAAFTISGPIFMIFSKRLRHQTEVDGEEQYVSLNSKNMRLPGSNSAHAGTDSEDDEKMPLNRSNKHRSLNIPNYENV